MDTVKTLGTNWPSTCRVCLTNTEDEMKCIFGDVGPTDDIVTKIIKCGGIPVDVMDGMPDKICNQCMSDLNTAYKFRSSCQESYSHLLNMVQEQKPQYMPKEVCSEEELKDEFESDDVYDDAVPIEPVYQQDEALDPIFISDEILIDEDYVPEFDDDSDAERYYIKDEPEDEPVYKPETKTKRKVRGEEDNDQNLKYICYCCGNMYKNQSKLNQHIKLHSAEKPHECEICKKKFAQTAQLARHMNSHTGNRPYKCKYCSSKFADPSTRIKHERIHTNDRPFKCLECGKAFSYSNVLKVHQKIHTGEKPFSCSVCHKKFTQSHHKKSHEKTHSIYLKDSGRLKKPESRTKVLRFKQ